MRNRHGIGIDELAVQHQDPGEDQARHDAAEMGAHARMIRNLRSRGHCPDARRELLRQTLDRFSPGNVVEIARRTYQQIP